MIFLLADYTNFTDCYGKIYAISSICEKTTLDFIGIFNKIISNLLKFYLDFSPQFLDRLPCPLWKSEYSV